MGTPSGIPEQPVLIVGPCSAEVSVLCGSMRAEGWTLLIADDQDRASWLASIQRVALILIAGGSKAHEVADVIRPVSNAPLVVLGAPTPQSVISLVEAGVDAVIDPRAGDADVLARLGALLRRMDRALLQASASCEPANWPSTFSPERSRSTEWLCHSHPPNMPYWPF